MEECGNSVPKAAKKASVNRTKAYQTLYQLGVLVPKKPAGNEAWRALSVLE